MQLPLLSHTVPAFRDLAAELDSRADAAYLAGNDGKAFALRDLAIHAETEILRRQADAAGRLFDPEH